ncbi:LIC_10190 family membrane protein [Coraliomargarita sp. W4R53]
MGFLHFQSVLLALLIYGLLALSYYGWGRLLLRAILPARDQSGPTSITYSIWLGWAGSLFVLQLIHLFFPIHLMSAAPVFAIGILMSLVSLVKYRRKIASLDKIAVPTQGQRVVGAAFVVSGVLLALWLASRSMLPPNDYDSGLYHFSAIQWINAYPIVPGLGNLHGRLAFNQSFFTYVAALNFYPYFGHGRSIANSFLMLLSVATFLEVLYPLISRPRRLAAVHPLCWVPSLFCLPILGCWLISSFGLTSPSPDLACSLLQLVGFVIFCRLVADYLEHDKVCLGDCFVLLVLGATAISLKLSNLVFFGVIILCACAVVFQDLRRSPVAGLRLLLPVFLILLLMALQGFILSGAPLYPSSILFVDTEWSVSAKQLLEERNSIYAWARMPGAHWSEVLGTWGWIAPWFETLKNRYAVSVCYPVAIFVGLFALNALLRLILPRSKQGRAVEALLVIPLVAGLIFWFWTAPNPRFASAQFLLLPIAAACYLLSMIRGRVQEFKYLLMVCVLGLVINFRLISWAISHNESYRHVSNSGWAAVPTVPLKARFLEPGLLVHLPVSGDQTWDALLPAAPYYNENLRLIQPGDFSSGFTVKLVQNPDEVSE